MPDDPDASDSDTGATVELALSDLHRRSFRPAGATSATSFPGSSPSGA